MTHAHTVTPYRCLVDIVAKSLAVAGVAQDRAMLEAEIMAEADLLGVPSHGVRMLPTLLRAIGDGRVNPNPEVTVIRQHGATCMLNGNNGPGRSVAWHAMQEAMARAGTSGIGACLALHTTHWGRAHAYASRAAQHGLIGICMTNGMPCMAGWGSRTRIIGNNPIALGIPRKDRNRPIVLDMAMSQAAVGTVGTWLREGRAIPHDWGIDAQGKPSLDARSILSDGAVLPFGGHKGAGLALMIELLTAALAGSLFGPEIEMGDRSGLDPESCKLFIAIDPARFGGESVLTSRIEDFLNYLVQNTIDERQFRWPGERGWLTRDRNLQNGVPIHHDIVGELAAAGVHL